MLRLVFGWFCAFFIWLLWTTLFPPFVLLWWVISILWTGLLRWNHDRVRPLWLETPWDLLMHSFIWFHSVRMVDCDADVPGIVMPEASFFRGAVLVNHRSWADFIIDPAQAHCAVVARAAAVAICVLGSLIGLASDRIIVILRGKTSRVELMRKCAAYERFIMYPEGTRRASAANADEPVPLRVGGIKNLYEARNAALIVITVNKERIFDERRGRVSFGTVLYRARHSPITPDDHGTFESFHSAIEVAWQDTWRRAHALRTAEEANKDCDSYDDREFL